MQRFVICMPVFNDWDSARVVIERVVAAAADRFETSFVVVDDHSTIAVPEGFAATKTALGPGSNDCVEVLHLRRNVGHQRAIAVGLVHIAQNQPAIDGVVVMDSDGEDIPEQVLDLIAEFERQPQPSVVFARRIKRSEGIKFQVGYHAFRFVHRVLTGRRVEVGNFSLIPRSLLGTVVSVSEIWVHYAAGVMKARIPTSTIPLARGQRIAGQSKMNSVALVGHGLGALSIFGEEIVVRSLAACALGLVACVCAAMAGVAMNSVALGVVSAVAATIFLAAGIQGVLAAVVLYRLKSMMSVMPIGDAHTWLRPTEKPQQALLPQPAETTPPTVKTVEVSA